MAGALMQLVAYGAQDVYLTGNPQITFFKVVYKRHTNFSMELIQQVLSGNGDFGNTVRCKINRAGDLLHDCWVNVTMPALADNVTASDGTTDGDSHDSKLSYCNRVGFRLLKSVELRIGGQQIDRHTSLWMHLWTELTTPVEKKGFGGLNDLVGPNGTSQGSNTHSGEGDSGLTINHMGVQANGSSCASQTGDNTFDNQTGTKAALELWVPLQFSFCRNPGLALPLIALQYHEVELVLELETFDNCLAHKVKNPRGLMAALADPATAPTGVGLTSAGSLSSTLTVWGNYVFLDTEERKNFAQNPHEYLIETVQDMTTTCSSGRGNYRLNFNHPVKELVWFAQRNEVTNTGDTGHQIKYSANLVTVDTNAIGMTREEAYALKKHDADAVVVNPFTLLRGTLSATGKATAALTGVYYSGDSFTDGTVDARTVYTYATKDGIGEAPSDSAAELKITDTLPEGAHALNTSISADAEGNGPHCFSGTAPMCKSAVLKLNGQERFSERSSVYFNRVQPYQHHTGTPDLGVNCYSFALKPEEHQPSGTCNFSRIDNANLTVDCAAAGTLSVFAHGYNVLRVASGMGGLAYSN